MLKIKNDVDLKELVKYGLSEYKNFFSNDVISIDKYERLIYHKHLDTFEKGYRIMMIIAKLCQAGLVEKVVEE